MLSCSHVFHAKCLQNYEKFDTDANFGIAKKHCCPMCRHENYQKIEIDHDSMLIPGHCNH